MERICLIALLFLSFGCNRNSQPKWRPPFIGGHHIESNDVSILAFDYVDAPGRSIIFYFSFGTNSASDHTSNAESRTFDYSGVVTRSSNKEAILDYQITSTDETKIGCNGNDYALDDGTVFFVAPDGTVSQFPFAGLRPTKEYALDLKDFFSKRHESAIKVSE